MDFSEIKLQELDNQLESFIIDICKYVEFQDLKDIGILSHKMVHANKHVAYHLVYKVITLALLLRVATSVVRSFSAMKLVKNSLRNRMGDEWLNANLITNVEEEISKLVDRNPINHGAISEHKNSPWPLLMYWFLYVYNLV